MKVTPPLMTINGNDPPGLLQQCANNANLLLHAEERYLSCCYACQRVLAT